MIIPYYVDVPQVRKPWMNWLIVLANVYVFFGWQIHATGEEMLPYLQNGWDFSGMFTSAFMHGDILHLLGNLLFLWLFGNAVCAKLGNLQYLVVYVLMTYASGIGQAIMSDGYSLGASGAINGVVGIYLIFFPLNEIYCFYWIFLRPGTFSTSSGWMIALWFFYDILGVLISATGVAYGAHIGGFLAGAILTALLLKICWWKMDELEKSLLEVIGWDKGCKKTFWDKPKVDVSEGTIWNDMLNPQKAKAKAQQPPLPGKNTFVPSADMILKFECDCGNLIKMSAKYAGRQCRCSQCQTINTVPGRIA